MSLVVSGLSFSVTQMGADFLLVDAPVNLPPAYARLILQVDQNERIWGVHLPKGISTGIKRVEIAASV